MAKLPRTPRLADVNSLLAEMEALREMILNLLKNSVKAENISSKAAQNEQHIHNSKPHTSNEFEPAFETKPGAKPADIQKRESGNSRVFPLGLVLKACPEVINYGPDGAVGSWRDLIGPMLMALLRARGETLRLVV